MIDCKMLWFCNVTRKLLNDFSAIQPRTPAFKNSLSFFLSSPLSLSLFRKMKKLALLLGVDEDLIRRIEYIDYIPPPAAAHNNDAAAAVGVDCNGVSSSQPHHQVKTERGRQQGDDDAEGETGAELQPSTDQHNQTSYDGWEQGKPCYCSFLHWNHSVKRTQARNMILKVQKIVFVPRLGAYFISLSYHKNRFTHSLSRSVYISGFVAVATYCAVSSSFCCLYYLFYRSSWVFRLVVRPNDL